MSVRKRKWTTAKGVKKEAWIVDYVDQKGARHIRTFRRKKEADACADTTGVQVREGTHVADRATVTVSDAGAAWLRSGLAAGLERTTLEQYRAHLEYHIMPFLGRVLLSKLNPPTVREYEDRLRQEGRSRVMIRKVVGSLGAILADAQERGLVAGNVVRDLRGRRRQGKERQADRRRKGRLQVGVDIPAPAEIKPIIDHAEGRWRPLMMTAIFTGLRASELRGLLWTDVDLAAREVHVRRRADRFNVIGPPKSEASVRTIPIPSPLINVLREWRLACPKGPLGLVFPNGAGNIEAHANIVNRGLMPAQLAGGVVTNDGKPRYSGLHTLRHFYASWCINRRVDGGLELPLKTVQARLGHSSITMTADVYGHLFPRGDDGEEMADAARSLLA